MGALISGQFGQATRYKSLHAKLNKALEAFEEQKTVFAAQHLRETVLPGSELFGHYLAGDDHWVAELRYDHLIHEAEGPTLAVAIANAVKEIVNALGGDE